jgi:hypothetical protein
MYAGSMSLCGILTKRCRLLLFLLPDDTSKLLSELTDLNAHVAEMDTSIRASDQSDLIGMLDH